MTRILTIARIIWLEMLRRKDMYVLLILLGALLLALVSMDVFGLGGVVRYVLDAGLLCAWLLGWILAVAVSCRALPQEETRGTIFSLLAKPIRRGELILGKWLGAWTIVSGATLAFYLLVLVVVAWRGGSVNMATAGQAFLLHAMALGVISAIGIAFSTRLNQDAAVTLTAIVTGAAFLVVPRVPEFVTSAQGLKATILLLLYHLLPHFEVFDLRKRVVHDYGCAAWTPVLLAIGYGIALVGVALAIAWLAYHRKRFSRGVMLG